MSVLSIRGLGKRFGATWALADLHLDLTEGRRTAVIGPSGSGKTTLLRLIAGFETPDSGTISLDEQLIANEEAGVPAHRRNVGLVMQEGALFPHLNIIENIRFGIRDRGDGDKQALTLMDLVGLERTMASRAPHQLSGGQQQRVALARALARRPRLMLLDEPFSALDAELREQLRTATIAILAEARVATILVTHDRDEAMSMADELAILRQGRLIQVGAPRSVYLAPADENTATFLGQAIVLDAIARNNRATCILGDIPLHGSGSAGPCRILLRPEQLRLHVAQSGDQEIWHLESVELVGPIAHLRLSRAAPLAQLNFDTPSSGLPARGTPVTLDVIGEAHRFA